MKAKNVDVLLVEDSIDDYEIVSEVLQAENVRFHYAKDGVDALNFIFPNKSTNEVFNNLCLILLDLNLPKVDGLEVLRKIRLDSRMHNVPVVVLSSTNNLKEVSHAYELGANSFVVKPWQFDKFVNTVKAISLYWTQVNRKSI
jgi:DNA-binding response OmpR family regulator